MGGEKDEGGLSEQELRDALEEAAASVEPDEGLEEIERRIKKLEKDKDND